MAPAKPHPDLARSQFEEDVDVLEGSPLARRYGWVLEPDYPNLRLQVRMWSLGEHGKRQDDYYLDLDMSYYRQHPPGVTFVNPITRSFDPSKDARWLPVAASKPPHTDIRYHASYPINGVNRQMVCNSLTLEYYMTGHSPQPGERWDPGRHTLSATLSLLQTMLSPPHYGGRSG